MGISASSPGRRRRRGFSDINVKPLFDVMSVLVNVVKVTSPLDHDVTNGNLCIKGRFGFEFVQVREPGGSRSGKGGRESR